MAEGKTAGFAVPSQLAAPAKFELSAPAKFLSVPGKFGARPPRHTPGLPHESANPGFDQLGR